MSHRYDIRLSESCVDLNPLMVERQDPDNFICFQTRERCALEIAAYVFKPSSKSILLTVPRRCFFCGLLLLIMCSVCHVFMSVHCSIVVTCWERAGLLALMYVTFYCVCVTFLCGIMSQVWYLVVRYYTLCR